MENYRKPDSGQEQHNRKDSHQEVDKRIWYLFTKWWPKNRFVCLRLHIFLCRAFSFRTMQTPKPRNHLVSMEKSKVTVVFFSSTFPLSCSWSLSSFFRRFFLRFSRRIWPFVRFAWPFFGIFVSFLLLVLHCVFPTNNNIHRIHRKLCVNIFDYCYRFVPKFSFNAIMAWCCCCCCCRSVVFMAHYLSSCWLHAHVSSVLHYSPRPLSYDVRWQRATDFSFDFFS